MTQCFGIAMLPIAFLLWLDHGNCRAADPQGVSHSPASLNIPATREASTDCDPLPEEIELQRFKRQALQSVSVTGGGIFEFDRTALNSSFLELGVGTGIPMGSFENILGVTPRFRIDWIDAASNIDIPTELYEFELQFFYRRPLRDRLSLLAVCSPSIRSDLSTTDKAFRVFALGLLNWEYVPDRLTVSAGAVVLGRADLPILPAVGILWTPNRRTKMDLRFPLTKLSYRISKCGGESETWAYLSGGLGGNTWAVTRATEQSDELSLRDYRLSAGVQRLVNGGGGCFVDVGIALGRKLEYERDATEVNLDDAAIFRAGWRY